MNRNTTQTILSVCSLDAESRVASLLVIFAIVSEGSAGNADGGTYGYTVDTKNQKPNFSCRFLLETKLKVAKLKQTTAPTSEHYGGIKLRTSENVPRQRSDGQIAQGQPTLKNKQQLINKNKQRTQRTSSRLSLGVLFLQRHFATARSQHLPFMFLCLS